MNYLKVDNDVIPYIIEVKNNKNTYFRFKKEGYVKINKSKHQSKKSVLAFMTENKDAFLRKLDTVMTPKKSNDYYLLGIKYQIVERDTFTLDEDRNILYTNNSESHVLELKKLEKKIMLELLNGLKQKHLENKFINIKDISLKTRYTKTRHGSCNARTKSININLNLIHYDYTYIEYVFLHEITHINVQNHQKAFYDLLVKLHPEYKETRKKLKEIYR